MTTMQVFNKRVFDIFLSLILLIITLPLIFLALLIATVDTRSFGLFVQNRVGRNCRIIKVLKIKTMYDAKPGTISRSSITANINSEISASGSYLRKYKIDELPQLFNVLFGSMSFVGPRPDVPGYADKLEGDDAVILSIRPGITGPASIKYKNEEAILSTKQDPQNYNDIVVWPDKVRINIDYINNYSFLGDIKYILKTVLE